MCCRFACCYRMLGLFFLAEGVNAVTGSRGKSPRGTETVSDVMDPRHSVVTLSGTDDSVRLWKSPPRNTRGVADSILQSIFFIFANFLVSRLGDNAGRCPDTSTPHSRTYQTNPGRSASCSLRARCGPGNSAHTNRTSPAIPPTPRNGGSSPLPPGSILPLRFRGQPIAHGDIQLVLHTPVVLSGLIAARNSRAVLAAMAQGTMRQKQTQHCIFSSSCFRAFVL